MRLSCGLAIVQFRDRPRQLKTAGAASLLALALVALFGVGFGLKGDVAAGGNEVYAALALAVAAFVFATLARRAIAKDIALVKSMDRLR